jgi:hypothetical protein
MAIAAQVPVVPRDAAGPPDCKEFISSSPCSVRIDLSTVRPITLEPGSNDALHTKPPAPAHNDVMTKAGGVAVVILSNGSPFLNCTIAATPAAPTRDLSASVTSLLGTVGTLVIPAGSLSPLALSELTSVPETARAPRSPENDLNRIKASLNRVVSFENSAVGSFDGLSERLRRTLRTNWLYSFPAQPDANDPLKAEREAAAAVNALQRDVGGLMQPATDLLAGLLPAKALPDALNQFYKDHESIPQSLQQSVREVADGINIAVARGDLLSGLITDFFKKCAQIRDFLAALRPPYSTVRLRMARFAQKAVTEAITCKDAMTGTQPFDSIIFTAYYENTPVFDLSVGAILSGLHGRQVGVVSGPMGPGPPVTPTGATQPTAPASGPCVAFNPPETCLGVTSQSRVQFMPAAFVECHPENFKCWWAKPGQPRYPFGNLCSVGVAAGIAVNPNNGTGTAEFFEGFSFAIQRVSILFGVHDGRFQHFTDGYDVGQAVPLGASPRTERGWNFSPAIAVTYRSPVR